MKKPIFLENRDLARHWKPTKEWVLPIHEYDLPYATDTFNRHVGIEIEVEQCGDNRFPPLEAWSIVIDNSLRGEDAREFKTVFPCSCHDALMGLNEFFEMVEVRRTKGIGAFSFSERTSIHVHVDVRDLSQDEIKAATKLYMIFERSFFDLVGRDRRHNIFCIPLTESNILGMKGPGAWWAQWEKYCAVNLAPLRNFGTMEFRAMAGNDNKALISAWTLILASLVEFAYQTPSTEIDNIINTLKTESQYMQLAQKIFGDKHASLLTMFPEASDSAASLTKLL